MRQILYNAFLSEKKRAVPANDRGQQQINNGDAGANAFGQMTVNIKRSTISEAAAKATVKRKPRQRKEDTAEDLERRAIVGARIRQHRKARKWTLTQLQERSGLNNGNLSRIEHGQQRLTSTSMEALAHAFGMSLPELFQEVVEGDKKKVVNPGVKPKQIGHTATSTGSTIRHVGEYAKLSDIPEFSNVAIGTIEAQPNASSGEISFGKSDRVAHLFDGGTIRRIDAHPASLASFEIPDDCMKPRLHPKDVVVVDLDDKAVPMDGGVFAIVMDGETVAIRRLLPFVNRGLRIICDNKEYPEMTLSGGQASAVIIAGRVKSMRGNGGF